VSPQSAPSGVGEFLLIYKATYVQYPILMLFFFLALVLTCFSIAAVLAVKAKAASRLYLAMQIKFFSVSGVFRFMPAVSRRVFFSNLFLRGGSIENTA
jgi:hypothetical protein